MDDIIPFLALGLLFLCVFLLYQDRRIVHWKREAEEYRNRIIYARLSHEHLTPNAVSDVG